MTGQIIERNRHRRSRYDGQSIDGDDNDHNQDDIYNY